MQDASVTTNAINTSRRQIWATHESPPLKKPHDSVIYCAILYYTLLYSTLFGMYDIIDTMSDALCTLLYSTTTTTVNYNNHNHNHKCFDDEIFHQLDHDHDRIPSSAARKPRRDQWTTKEANHIAKGTPL